LKIFTYENNTFLLYFSIPSGKIVFSGGSTGISIRGEINHNSTKIGDIVEIEQFNLSGSYPIPATIIGKVSYDWDMSKPMGKRKSNEIILGVGYNPKK